MFLTGFPTFVLEETLKWCNYSFSFTQRSPWVRIGLEYVQMHLQLFVFMQRLDVVSGRHWLPPLRYFIPFTSASPIPPLPPLPRSFSRGEVLGFVGRCALSCLPFAAFLAWRRSRYVATRFVWPRIYNWIPHPTNNSGGRGDRGVAATAGQPSPHPGVVDDLPPMAPPMEAIAAAGAAQALPPPPPPPPDAMPSPPPPPPADDGVVNLTVSQTPPSEDLPRHLLEALSHEYGLTLVEIPTSSDSAMVTGSDSAAAALGNLLERQQGELFFAVSEANADDGSVASRQEGRTVGAENDAAGAQAQTVGAQNQAVSAQNQDLVRGYQDALAALQMASAMNSQGRGAAGLSEDMAGPATNNNGNIWDESSNDGIAPATAHVNHEGITNRNANSYAYNDGDDNDINRNANNYRYNDGDDNDNDDALSSSSDHNADGMVGGTLISFDVEATEASPDNHPPGAGMPAGGVWSAELRPNVPLAAADERFFEDGEAEAGFGFGSGTGDGWLGGGGSRGGGSGMGSGARRQVTYADNELTRLPANMATEMMTRIATYALMAPFEAAALRMVAWRYLGWGAVGGIGRGLMLGSAATAAAAGGIYAPSILPWAPFLLSWQAATSFVGLEVAHLFFATDVWALVTAVAWWMHYDEDEWEELLNSQE